MKPYPNLEEFQVEDSLLEEAICFQLDKQLAIDGRRLLSKLWAGDSRGKTEAEMTVELEKLATAIFQPNPLLAHVRNNRGPAKVVFFDRGAPSKERNWGHVYTNSRPYFIGVVLNRDMTAPSFMKWVDREFLPFVKASMKLAARIDMPGAIEYTKMDEDVFRRVGGAATEHHYTNGWYRTKADAAHENLRNRSRQSPSLKKLRAKLLSVACYRFKMAGFTFREYNEAQRRVGLEVYEKRNSAPVVVDITEEAFNGRLKIATGLLREEWAGFGVEKPEDIPEAGFTLGKRFH